MIISNLPTRKGLSTLLILYRMCLLLALGGWCYGCGPSPQEGNNKNASLTITTHAFRGFHTTSFSGGSQPEYVVAVTILNTSDRPLACDTIEGSFFSKYGPALQQPTTNAQEDIFTIDPGKPESFDFRTNGYTTDLVLQAKGGPLFFSITIKKDDRNIAGPFSARLPPVSDLPTDYEKHTENKTGYLLQLQ